MIKVSIIVPVYKTENYLHQCIQSLLNQTLHDIEIILVDDGSPDSCPDICEDYAKKDKRIRVIHKENAGLGYARNSGLEIATGKYVAFVDSDDYIDINMYKCMYEKAEQYGADSVLCGFHRDINGVIHKGLTDNMSNEEKIINLKKEYLPNVIGSMPNESNHQSYGISVWANIFKNEVIQKNQIKFVSERVYVSEDLIFLLDFAANASNLLLLPKRFYYYRCNIGSVTLRYNPSRFEKQINLCQEVRRRIYSYGYKTSDFDLDLRLKRMIIYECLFAVREAIDFLPFAQSIQRLRHIVQCQELKDTLNKYPINRMPLKHRVFCTMLKNNHTLMLWVLYKAKRICKS